jgi:hypothetical protein
MQVRFGSKMRNHQQKGETWSLVARGGDSSEFLCSFVPLYNLRPRCCASWKLGVEFGV